MQSEPRSARTPVWALSLSLAATQEITIVFSSSGYLDVSVHRVPPVHLWIQCTVTEVSSAGFPHSDICGSMDICSSPQLFAAYHVFLRLLVPRHPPCALFSLTLLRIHSVVCFFLRTSESFLTHCFVSDVFSFILIFYPVSLSKNLLDFRYLRFSFSIRFSRYENPRMSASGLPSASIQWA